jgi:hypothetical protein
MTTSGPTTAIAKTRPEAEGRVERKRRRHR